MAEAPGIWVDKISKLFKTLILNLNFENDESKNRLQDSNWWCLCKMNKSDWETAHILLPISFIQKLTYDN